MAWYDDKDLEIEAEKDDMFRPLSKEEREDFDKKAREAAKEFDEKYFSGKLYKTRPGYYGVNDYLINEAYDIWADISYEWGKARVSLRSSKNQKIATAIERYFTRDTKDALERIDELVEVEAKKITDEEEFVREWNFILHKVIEKFKLSKYRLIKIGTGINRNTGNPNFQVYLDRDSLEGFRPFYKSIGPNYKDNVRTFKGVLLHAKNLTEAKKLLETEWTQDGQFIEDDDLLYSIPTEGWGVKHRYEPSGWAMPIFESEDFKWLQNNHNKTRA